ncbi:ABC-2 transporter permease [Vallitalea pronyensis]|uniref:ABC-2 transporter permease n=1 Tax=Vallitalea pronyensis TaxID=1348613 RepID=A0A8J8MM78_9FIRM|nr:ABC-2 transporter permease [Vallitalea pronyensis]QUI24437.1 ABC-2 transporter permease [Vallitalea pronyensis]
MVNKTLFLKDWKTLKWNSLLFFFILFTVRIIPAYIHLYAYTHTKGTAHVSDPYTLWDIFRVNLLNVNLSHTLINVAFVILTAFILFYDSRSGSYSLLASMPFNRQEIIVTKLVSGVVSILMPYVFLLLFGIGIYYTYINNTVVGSPDILFNLAKWFLMVLLVYLTIFLMAMMFQSLLGNQIIAAVITGIMLIFPIGFLGMIQLLINQLTGGVAYSLYHLGQKLTIVDYIAGFHRDYLFKVILLVFLSIVFTEITYLAYSRNQFEKNGQFSMFLPLEKVFVVCFSICTSLLVTVILSMSSSFRYFGISSLFLLIFGFAVGLLFSIILIKLLKRLSHRPK